MRTEAHLIEAVKAGDLDRVREHLSADPSAARSRDENGVSALMLARYYRAPDEVVDAVREHAGDLDVWEAATLGDVERLRALIDEDDSRVNAWSSDRGTPLHFAAFFGQPAAARFLLERGADVHAVSPTFGNVTPLHSAAAAPSLEIVRMLVDAGADVNARQNGGFVALHAAAQNGDPEMARVLLEHGAERNAATDDERTALSIAEDQGHDAVAALLR